jgi:hypothetical protein
MIKLISNWPGRLVSLFVPAALVASFCAPAPVLALKEMSLGGGDSSGREGDPLDTNDAGGGGGGHIQRDATAPSAIEPVEWISDRYQVLVVPEVLGGTVILRIIVVDKSDLGRSVLRMGGYHAP